MAGPPPPYEGVEATDLVVHLQVWHYNSNGRSPDHNEEFAALFRNHNLERWEVLPLDLPGERGPSAHDKYVPVEVRFRHCTRAYNDPGEYARFDAQHLFSSIAPPFIYHFFTGISSIPHNLNMFPVGVPEEWVSLFTHAYMLNQLNLSINVLVVPEPVVTNDVRDWIQDTVNTAADAMRLLAAIVGLYALYSAHRNGRNDVDVAEIRRRAPRAAFFSQVVPPQLGELQRLFEQFRRQANGLEPRGAVDLRAEVRAELLHRTARPLVEYLRLANRMEGKLKKLEESASLSEALSHQDLYELVQDARRATIVFSTLEEPALRLVELIRNECEEVSQSQRRWVNGATVGAIALTALVVFCCSNPAGWAAATFGASSLTAITGGAAVLDAASIVAHDKWDAQLKAALSKEKNARECSLAIQTLRSRTQLARAAIGLVFAQQVMRKRLDQTLPEHEKKDILDTLGVDVDAISGGDDVFSQQLIRDRLRSFREGNINLRVWMENVESDGNFKLMVLDRAA